MSNDDNDDDVTQLRIQKQLLLQDILGTAIAHGVPVFNQGDHEGCLAVYVAAATKAIAVAKVYEETVVVTSTDVDVDDVDDSSSVPKQLQRALDEANKSTRPAKEGAWILRRCFDKILATLKEEKSRRMESLEGLLRRTIGEGAPLFNQGHSQECYELYLDTAQYVIQQPAIQSSHLVKTLNDAIQKATKAVSTAGKNKKTDYKQAAWILRHCFDELLEDAISVVGKPSSSGEDEKLEEDPGYWQDELMKNTTDIEIGTCLADFNVILREQLQQERDSFSAAEAVDVMVQHGLAPDRDTAVMKCDSMVQAKYLVSLSTPQAFEDGTHLYWFGSDQEMQQKLEELQSKPQPLPEGSLERQLQIALQTSFEESTARKTSTATPLPPSCNVLLPIDTSNPEHRRGMVLANKSKEVEAILDISNRQHRLKTYEQCFIGKDAVERLAKADICQNNREEALRLLEELHSVGLIHHVLFEHDFKAEHLFYQFTSSADLRQALDEQAHSQQQDFDEYRYAALSARYQQHLGSFDVPSILNSFFACDNQEGWDSIDLQNWRNNMKRWGFGRREDQDDDMVELLAPLAVNAASDPEAWFDSLSVEDREEWTSPWGVLAQIAIFDQVPRSAFRGTPQAFKWDDLAIKASKLAIERGYFDSDYQSTLNQFLILLPLEHSEDWEDQKLGVSLILQLLSKVAVEDGGHLTDYDIIKRMEFSKRLSTAFLEHAQVIAKFKRYPHRNKALGRSTTLEERIWLASDLVPRWAKSQLHPETEDGTNQKKNLIRLPVIPLKRLTRR